MMSFIGYWLPCIIIGASISIDVLIATVSQFHNQRLSLKSWVMPVTLTHTIFPVVGYWIFWQAGKDASAPLTALLGLTGATLISLLVYEIFCEHIGREPKVNISHYLSQYVERVCKSLGHNVDFDNHNARYLVRVLAVSWDALWIGPAIASNTDVGSWTDLEVYLSFLIAGFIVAIVAYSALSFSVRLRKLKFNNSEQMAKYLHLGIIAELSVIGGFGVLSLARGFGMDINLYQSILCSSLITMIASLIYFNEMHKELVRESQEAIDN